MVTGIRHWSTPDYTRVAIDVDSEVKYEAGRVPDPDRIFFDLPNTKLASVLVGKSFDVQDGFLKKIRVAQYQPGYTRVVLEVADVSDYSAFILPNPYRLIIDVHGRQPQSQTLIAKANASESAVRDDEQGEITAVEKEKSYRSVEKANESKSSAKPISDDSTSPPVRSASSATPSKVSGHTTVVDNDEPSGSIEAAAKAKSTGANTTGPAASNAHAASGSTDSDTLAANQASRPAVLRTARYQRPRVESHDPAHHRSNGGSCGSSSEEFQEDHEDDCHHGTRRRTKLHLLRWAIAA